MAGGTPARPQHSPRPVGAGSSGPPGSSFPIPDPPAKAKQHAATLQRRRFILLWSRKESSPPGSGPTTLLPAGATAFQAGARPRRHENRLKIIASYDRSCCNPEAPEQVTVEVKDAQHGEKEANCCGARNAGDSYIDGCPDGMQQRGARAGEHTARRRIPPGSQQPPRGNQGGSPGHTPQRGHGNANGRRHPGRRASRSTTVQRGGRNRGQDPNRDIHHPGSHIGPIGQRRHGPARRRRGRSGGPRLPAAGRGQHPHAHPRRDLR